MSSASQPSAYGGPTPVATASVTITLFTNSQAGSVTNISGQCLDSGGNTIPGRNFTGMGQGAKENFQNVVTNCPVTFKWSEQSNLAVLCTAFNMAFTHPSVPSGAASPFAQPSYSHDFNPGLSSPNTLISPNIVNGNASWIYSGSVTTQVSGQNAVALPFDPEIEVAAIG